MAQDDKTQKRSNVVDLKKANALDRAAARLLQNIDASYSDQRVISEQDAEFQHIIDRQLDIAKGVAGNQVVDFIASLRSSQKNRGPGRPPKNALGVETADLFTENVGDVFTYFQDLYKNRYLEVSDLKFISKFIPSLGMAVRIYLDAIVSSDDVSQTVTRNIRLPNITDSDKKVAMSYIEKMEKDMKLLKKLKVTYRKTLVSGTFYVYHISYKELFEQYSQGVASGRISKDGSPLMNGGNARQGLGRDPNHGALSNAPVGHMPSATKQNVLGIAQEAFQINDGAVQLDYNMAGALEGFGCEAVELAQRGLIYKCNLDGSTVKDAVESIMGSFPDCNLPFKNRTERYDRTEWSTELCKSLESDMPNIYFNATSIPFEALNEASGVVDAGLESSLFKNFFTADAKQMEEIEKKIEKDNAAPDGTYDLNTMHRRAQSFNGVSGTYLKWIDYKYMMPIEVLGHKIGYYHVVTTPKNRKKGIRGTGRTAPNGILSTGSMSLFDQMDMSEKRKESAIQNIVDTISEAILNQFGSSFVRKNAAFKELIAECIIANGLVDNDYMIQFIPVNQVIEFNCNEDENGKGESILSDAVFPAHLLLSTVVSKILNYLNKGGNRTIAHISSGRVNKQLSNQANRVIRDLQAGNVTFTDLLSSSQVFSKVTRDSNIAMPKDQQGNRLVEFEIQEGQQIDLNTEYETMLEKWCMMATGIPSTAMDYENDVSVAKKIVSDNIQVAGRVASLQADFEDPTTELYRALIHDSDMDEQLKAQLENTLLFKLPRPRILANQNTSEALNTIYQNGQTIANIKIGEDASEPDDMELKSLIVQKYVEREAAYIDWGDIDSLVEDARIEQNKRKTEKSVKAAANQSQPGENPDEAVSQLDSMDNF